MAKKYKKGGKYYLPVKVLKTDVGILNPIEAEIEYGDGSTDSIFLEDDPDLLLTKEEICNTVESVETANLKAENAKLKEALDKVSERRDKWTEAAQAADKDVDERYDAQVDLVTAKAAIDHLQEENKKLKQEVAERDELLSDAADRIKTLEKAADRSIFFEEIAKQQEVIDALVEKIQRLKGGD